MTPKTPEPDRKISLAELAAADGKEGRPVYLAFRGQVYDVSASDLWLDGLHRWTHPAGLDLTAAIMDAPHGPEVLKKFPVVGILSKTED